MVIIPYIREGVYFAILSVMETHNKPFLFSLYLGIVVSLYVTVIAAISTLFGTYTIWFVDEVDSYWMYDSAVSSVRYGIAMLLVFAPVYFGLMYYAQKQRSKTEESSYAAPARWLIYISFVVVGGAIAFQLVNLILSFLEGELSIRFLAKTVTLLTLTLAPALYHWLDLGDYWQLQNRQHKMIAFVYGLVAVFIVSFGVFTIETPTEARERSLDQRQVQDLQELTWRIDDYVRAYEELPQVLSDVYQRPIDVPTAPGDRAAYRYTIVDQEALTYELCATFVHASDRLHEQPIYRAGRADTIVDWNYDAGEWCFELAVNTN